MKKLKVMTILGTRPEIIKLFAVIRACDKYFNHVLVHTGQNWAYGLNEVFFENFGLRKPDHYLGVAGKNLGETIGNVISKSYDLLQSERPDALLVLGDTNSVLSAISAKRLKIPIFHMEAGNRCFNQNHPEEINRKIVDHISDINLPYTEHARRYLLDEGFQKEHIYVTGSPMPEIFESYKDKIDSSKILNELNLEKEKYILVSMHREQNVDKDETLFSLVTAINALAEKYRMPIIFSTHPRTLKKIKERNILFHQLIRSFKPFGFFDYNYLQKNSFCVVSDSGTLSEESAILGFPAVLIRISTERPEVIDTGSLIIGGVKENSILQSVEIAANSRNEKLDLPEDYKNKNISIKIVKTIQSYVDIINKKTWDKD